MIFEVKETRFREVTFHICTEVRFLPTVYEQNKIESFP